jgi:hypothetical protein
LAWRPDESWEESVAAWPSANEPPLPEQESAMGARQASIGAILEAIERALPKDFRSSSGLRSWLLHVGREAQPHGGRAAGVRDGEVHRRFMPVRWDVEDRAAAEDERGRYLAFVADLTLEQAATPGRVPYRHVMSDSQRRRVGKLLKKGAGSRRRSNARLAY